LSYGPVAGDVHDPAVVKGAICFGTPGRLFRPPDRCQSARVREFPDLLGMQLPR
jgi:hypothetical protein